MFAWRGVFGACCPLVLLGLGCVGNCPASHSGGSCVLHCCVFRSIRCWFQLSCDMVVLLEKFQTQLVLGCLVGRVVWGGFGVPSETCPWNLMSSVCPAACAYACICCMYMLCEVVLLGSQWFMWFSMANMCSWANWGVTVCGRLVVISHPTRFPPYNEVNMQVFHHSMRQNQLKSGRGIMDSSVRTLTTTCTCLSQYVAVSERDTVLLTTLDHNCW